MLAAGRQSCQHYYLDESQSNHCADLSGSYFTKQAPNRRTGRAGSLTLEDGLQQRCVNKCLNLAKKGAFTHDTESKCWYRMRITCCVQEDRAVARIGNRDALWLPGVSQDTAPQANELEREGPYPHRNRLSRSQGLRLDPVLRRKSRQRGSLHSGRDRCRSPRWFHHKALPH